MNRKIANFCCAFLFLSQLICATQLEPWFGRNLELEARFSYLLETYHSVATSEGRTKLSRHDSFYNFSLGTSAFDLLAGELELILSDSHGFDWDCVRLSGRYALMNDILGEDPVSLITGMTVTQASTAGLHDISSFHHGKIEAELHAAVGRELSCDSFWTSRYWAVLGVGLADVGSAWIRLNGSYEKNWWDKYQARIFINTLWGLGHNRLNVHSFRGYGSIAHQSIDAGASLSYCFPLAAVLNLEYSRRLFARNFPRGVNQFKVCFFYPFGL